MGYIYGKQSLDTDVRDWRVVCTTKPELLPDSYELACNVSVQTLEQINSCVMHAVSSVGDYLSCLRDDNKNNIKYLDTRSALSSAIHNGSGEESGNFYYCRCLNDQEIKESIIKDSPVICIVQGDSAMPRSTVIYGWDADGWIIQQPSQSNQYTMLPYSTNIIEAWSIVDSALEFLKCARIEDLEQSNIELELKIDELHLEIHWLERQIKNTDGSINDKNVLEEFHEILVDAKSEEECATHILEDQQKEIQELWDKIMIVDTPFSSDFGPFVAKIINICIRIYNKLTRKIRKHITRE